MSTEAFSVIGTVAVFDGVTIGEVESLDGGDLTINSEDVLTCDSADHYADMILKALNSGQCTFTCIFQPNNTTGNYALLKTKAETRVKGTLLLTYPNTANFSGQAGIVGLKFPDFPDAEALQRFTVTFKRAGKHTFTGTTG